MRQHDAAGLGRRDAAAGLPRGPRMRDQASSRAPPHGRNGERRHERQTQPAAMGAGEPPRRDRAPDLRLQIDQQPGRQRKEPREHHLTTKCAAVRVRHVTAANSNVG